jgi:hypothetical protein
VIGVEDSRVFFLFLNPLPSNTDRVPARCVWGSAVCFRDIDYRVRGERGDWNVGGGLSQVCGCGRVVEGSIMMELNMDTSSASSPRLVCLRETQMHGIV